MVRVVRLERTVSWSQTRRDTNFAIPGYSISAMIPRRTEKIKFFLSVVIHVVKATFMPFSAIGENPANACVTRLCGISPYPVPDTATALPNHALYHLSYTRIFSFLLLSLWSKMWSNGDFRRFCGRDKVPKPQRFQGLRGFRISPSCRGCYTLPKQARYQLRYTRIRILRHLGGRLLDYNPKRGGVQECIAAKITERFEISAGFRCLY